MIQQKLNFSTSQYSQITLEKSLSKIDSGVSQIKKRSIEQTSRKPEPKKRKITQTTSTDSSVKNQSLLTSWIKKPETSTAVKGINKGWEKTHPFLDKLYSQKKEEIPVSTKKIQQKKRNSLKDKCKVKHIRGSEEHFELLQKILDVAKEHILITTHSLTWIPNDVFDLFREAADRGIKIHIVYNMDIDERIAEFFEDYGIRYEQSSIHGKYLIMDKTQFVVGSYNWLDFRNVDDEGIEESSDRSFKISKNEKYVHQLRGKVWSEIISHREKPSEKKDDFKKLSVSGDSSNLTLLTTLYDHENFLVTLCREAKRKIEIYSPFVAYSNATKRLSDIAKALQSKSVKIHLFVGEGDERLKGFIRNHAILRDTTTVQLDDFHRKTLIIDDELISEGSFNWLSSSRRLDSKFHNQDASLVLKGPLARDLIEDDS